MSFPDDRWTFSHSTLWFSDRNDIFCLCLIFDDSLTRNLDRTRIVRSKKSNVDFFAFRHLIFVSNRKHAESSRRSSTISQQMSSISCPKSKWTSEYFPFFLFFSSLRNSFLNDDERFFSMIFFGLIILYFLVLSIFPFFFHCRFFPSCSDYCRIKHLVDPFSVFRVAENEFSTGENEQTSPTKVFFCFLSVNVFCSELNEKADRRIVSSLIALHVELRKQMSNIEALPFSQCSPCILFCAHFSSPSWLASGFFFWFQSSFTCTHFFHSHTDTRLLSLSLSLFCAL